MSASQGTGKGVIHGYSERGVVNALFESLVAADDIQLFREFLSLMVHWDRLPEEIPAQSVPEEKPAHPVPEFDAYEVFIDASLSDFGDPDVLVFLKREDRDVGGYFIEAKMETFLHSSPLVEDAEKSRYTSNASSLLHELFLKLHFVGACHSPNRWLAGNLVAGVERVYDKDKRAQRKIGENHMVLALARRLRRFILSEREPWYVSLTTDPDTRDPAAPADSGNVMKLVSRILKWNPPKEPGLSIEIEATFQNRLLLLSWQKVFSFVNDRGHSTLARVCHQLERNIPKFKFPKLEFTSVEISDAQGTPIAPLLDLLTELTTEAEGTNSDTGKPKIGLVFCGRPESFTITVGGLALFTGTLHSGLDGPLFSLYPVQKAVRDELHKKNTEPKEWSMELLLNCMWPETLLVKASDLDKEDPAEEVLAGKRRLRHVVEAHLRYLARKSSPSKGKPQ